MEQKTRWTRTTFCPKLNFFYFSFNPAITLRNPLGKRSMFSLTKNYIMLVTRGVTFVLDSRAKGMRRSFRYGGKLIIWVFEAVKITISSVSNNWGWFPFEQGRVSLLGQGHFYSCRLGSIPKGTRFAIIIHICFHNSPMYQ